MDNLILLKLLLPPSSPPQGADVYAGVTPHVPYQADFADKDGSTSLTFTIPEKVGALGKALKVFEVSPYIHTLTHIPYTNTHTHKHAHTNRDSHRYHTQTHTHTYTHIAGQGSRSSSLKLVDKHKHKRFKEIKIFFL